MLSIALLGAVVATRVHAGALVSLSGLPRPERGAAAAAIARAGAQPIRSRLAGLSPHQARHIGELAYVSGLRAAYLIGAAVLVAGSILAALGLRGAHTQSPAGPQPAGPAEPVPAGPAHSPA